MQAAHLPPPKKRFGQNFLVQPGIVRRIVAAVAPRPEEALVEIGPGPGALTRALLEELAESPRPLLVIELDRDMLPGLRALAPESRLEVLPSDALEVNFGDLAHSAGRTLRIVGNLPYNISTPLLFHLLDWREQIADMHFMLQKEVVDRIVARPGTRSYGRLSVMIQAVCGTESLFPVAPGNFFPVPKVDSAFVRLKPHAIPLVPDLLKGDFARAVSMAFAQRRKTLANNFKGILNGDMLRALEIDPQGRAETLDVPDFLRIAEALKTPPQGDRT